MKLFTVIKMSILDIIKKLFNKELDNQPKYKYRTSGNSVDIMTTIEEDDVQKMHQKETELSVKIGLKGW